MHVRLDVVCVIRRRLAGLISVGFVLSLAAAPQAAAEPPFRALSTFDRLATFYEEGTAIDRITVTQRASATKSKTDVFVDDNTGPLVNFQALAWSPGAASLAATELFIPSNPQAADRIRVYEYPTGPVKSLDSEFNAVRADPSFFRLIGTPRWSGTGLRLVAPVSEAGIVSIKPDGSSPQVTRPQGTAPVFGSTPESRYAALPDGRFVTAKATTGSNGFLDLFVEGANGQPEKQLTFTPFFSEHAPAVSPDGKRVAYLQGANNDTNPVHDLTGDTGRRSQLAIVDIDGANQQVISPEPLIGYRPPAWRPDGKRIGFMGLLTTRLNPPHGDRHNQVLFSIAPDGTDLVRHTPVIGDLSDPNPWPIGRNAVFLAWGRTCVTILQCNASLSVVQNGPVGFSIVSEPKLANAASIGFLVEKYVKRRKLRRVGRVPFGNKHRGKRHVRWNLKLKGKRVKPGRYRITLRAVAGTIPLDRATRVDLVVPKHGKPKLRRARVKS